MLTREERKQRIVERLQARIQTHEAIAKSKFERERQISACIPMGQPILVGHHSERRHRRDIERMRNLMQSAFAHQTIAERLEDRLDTAGRSISRKDADAIELYQEKLKRIENNRECMKNANKILKCKDSDETKIEKLKLLGYTMADCLDLLKPDFAGRIGFSYHLTNSGAKVRRIKQKIEQLQRERSRTTSEETRDGITVKENDEHQGIEISFPGKPAQETIDKLKQAGFRWAFRAKVWYKNRRDDYTLQTARRIAWGI